MVVPMDNPSQGRAYSSDRDILRCEQASPECRDKVNYKIVLLMVYDKIISTGTYGTGTGTSGTGTGIGAGTGP